MAGSGQAPLRIELLGVPRLVLPDGKPHVLERRDAALLAWLALHGPTPRSRLVGLLWPDLPTRAAQGNLRQRLFRLKQRSGVEIVASDPLMALAQGLRHDLESKAPALDTNASAGTQVLLGALDYADCGELAEWVAGARERWAGECREQLARHAAQLEAEGRIAEALAFAERLTHEAPTAEHAHRRLMRLHYRRGDRAAALAAFERCGELLRRELGTAPGLETRELAALIERSGALPPPVAAPSPVATLRPPRLIGREREWQAISSAWQQRQPVLLRGEPGIGKSRLAADFAAAQKQPHVYRAHPGDPRMPYSLLVRLLRGLLERFGAVPEDWVVTEFKRLLPELGAQPAGKLEPLRLRHAVNVAMRHWQRRGLVALVIDDLHFADEASLEWLLAWLAQPGLPSLLLAVRPNEVPDSLQRWTAEHDAHALLDLTLAPLGQAEVVALLDSLAIAGLDSAAWAAPLTRHTGGNPLFILETLKAQLAAPGAAWQAATPELAAPAHIGKLLERRLEQLSPEALRLARVAALAGTDFSAELAAQVLGQHVLDLAEAWSELERAQIISDAAFAHDLILDATLRSVPEAIGLVIHRAVARWLETAGRPAARIAHHWYRAREWQQAAPYFEAAARAAHTAARPLEALALWDAAAACHENAGAPDDAFTARCSSVDSAIAVGPSEQVKTRVDALLATSRGEAQRLAALIAQAQHVATGGGYAKAVQLTTEALEIARRLGDRRREFMAINLLGVSLTVVGRAAEGLALFDTVAAAVKEAGDDGIEAEFCAAFGYALHAGGRFAEAAVWFARSADIAEQLGETQTQAVVLGNLAACLGHLGQHERALVAAQRALAVQARLGEIRGEPYAVNLLNLGMFCLAAGRYSEGLAAYRQALELSRESGADSLAATMETHLANTYLALGQPARARQVLTPLQPDAPDQPRTRRAAIEWRIDAVAGSPEPERLLQLLQERGSSIQVIDRLALELMVAAALPAAESAQWSERIRDEARTRGQPTVALSALIRLADAQRRLGRAEEAAASARTAVAEAASCGRHDIGTPEFWWLAFEAFDSSACEAEALHALRTGAEWARAAAAHVPDAFRESFLHRSRFVPRLLAMAKDRLGS